MRRGSIFWGLVIILAGVLLLLNQFGLLPRGLEAYFWPGVLILVGVWFLVSPRISRRGLTAESASIPLENASEAEIELHHGAGRLKIDALQEPLQLAAGTFSGGVEQNTRRDGSRVYLTLRSPEGLWYPSMGSYGSIDWNLGLTRDIPLRLRLHTGAGESNLDLADLKVIELRIETGASATRVTLPANAGSTLVNIKAGAASVELRVPQGVAARIRVTGGLTGTNVDRSRFPQMGEVYQSPDFDGAANRMDISVEMGAGSIDIR